MTQNQARTRTRAPAPETPAPETPAPETRDELLHLIDEIAEQKELGTLEWRLAEVCRQFRTLDAQSGTARLSRAAVSGYAKTYEAWSGVPSFKALPYRLARMARRYADAELVAAFLSGGETALKALLPGRKKTAWQAVVEACSRAIARGVAAETIISAVDALS